VRATSRDEGFDNVIIPEIVPASISFDLFDFAPDHPARSTSDTYYTDDKNICAPTDTVMWYYYTQLPEVKARIARGEKLAWCATARSTAKTRSTDGI